MHQRHATLMPLTRLSALVLLLVLALPLTTWAHGGAVAVTGFMEDYNKDLERAAKKLTDLAEAIPADKYDWRPAEGIRSVSESLMHVASTNFYLSRDLGIPLPEDLPKDLETVTSKAEAMAWLERSFDQVRKATVGAGTRLDTKIEVFGRPRSVRSLLFLFTGHAHEHLGQLIAYARSFGTVPPWSR